MRTRLCASRLCTGSLSDYLLGDFDQRREGARKSENSLGFGAYPIRYWPLFPFPSLLFLVAKEWKAGCDSFRSCRDSSCRDLAMVRYKVVEQNVEFEQMTAISRPGVDWSCLSRRRVAGCGLRVMALMGEAKRGKMGWQAGMMGPGQRLAGGLGALDLLWCGVVVVLKLTTHTSYIGTTCT